MSTSNTITVYGTSLISTAPDMANLNFSASELHEKPSEALNRAHNKAQQILTFLKDLGIDNIVSSKLSINPNRDKDKRYFTANIRFYLTLHDLSILDETVIGLVDAGVDNIKAVNFESSKISEQKNSARKQAINDARLRAQIYADEAKLQLGKIVSIIEIEEYDDYRPLRVKIGNANTIPVITPENVTTSAYIKVVFALDS